MGIHVEYGTVDEITVTQEEAVKVYKALAENQDQGWPIHPDSTELYFEALDGADHRDSARQAVAKAYRLDYKHKMHTGYPYGVWFEEMCLDLYAAVGIEPPDPAEKAIGHGM